ncbi:putative SWI/SNF family DNA-dependent ATPase Ris1 [Aspergillus nomiae NRRL 13137]|uniref:Putative SWI/SNF family DNA-dependent ATPase Ris1 n=1 Tax=Aspergillus nomiae NRRL (strain ATCC 15546 / NRRL 13137 / CBS 260.88 / M93) TaxID=1509407 RepID=A0A0L1J838_ASPN3|nr:putative SWI/SNF family DNA-dependent ATPase Ris1 [Aspergillus nomiae NRRL 13137]KNG87578.1 putative SWI/SNF family DNA-dependent ATPase Ris1 [Aspergillus nomiae NRRL 13137]
MASPTDASIEDLLEDLQLNHVILQSLEEQRPHAVAEKQEILAAIKTLETRLAELRGTATKSPPHSHFAPHQGPENSFLYRAQLDGSSRSSPVNSPWGLRQDQSTMSPPSQPFQSARKLAESSQPLGPLTIRKRGREEDDDRNHALDDGTETDWTDDLELPSKRVATKIPSSSPISLPVRSLQGQGPKQDDGFDDSMDELRKVLGLDSNDILELQDEQRKAERWLEKRKEQERLDEEYARRLEGLQESPRPASARSTSSTHYSGFSLPSPAPMTRNGTPFPNVNRSIPGAIQPTDIYRSPFVPPPLPETNRPGHQPLQPTITPDSDDSDIAEISAHDFELLIGPSSKRPFVSQHSIGGSHYPLQDSFLQQRPYSNMYPYLESMPGPSGIGGPGPAYGPHVLQNTMARLSAGKELLEHAGKSIFGKYPNPFSPYDSSVPLYPGPTGYDMNKLPEWMSDYYGADPKKVNEEIKQLLETIRPDSDISTENREGTPEALKFTLLEHQKLGLAWMKSMEEQEQKGGILADDMGLGKTIQAIALMVSRPSTDEERKPTLIIAPVALMQQWKREIGRILKPGRYQLSVYVLHGEKRAVSFRDLKNYDVVLTTFGTLSSELKRREKYDELQSSDASEQTLREIAKSLPCLGPSSKWYRVIIDEAQCIKNRNTKAALACCRLNATYRWCMSGTPMMNNVEELHSLLRFLRIKPYSNLERFNHDFTRPLKGSSVSAQRKAMRQLQVLLKAVLLRRTKDSKIDGKPILQLPQRISEKVHSVFSEDELELYNSLEARTQLQFNRYLEAGTVGRNYSNILVLLLRLRQACCHPHLITDFSVKLNANTDDLDLIANAKEFDQDVVIRLRSNNDDLECPICMDAVENPIIFFPCGHSTCAECFSRISDPSLALRQGHDGAVEVKCPNCRGKVDPKKITDHVSFRKVHDPDHSQGLVEEEPAEPAEEQDESDDSDDDDSLTRFIVNDEEDNHSSPKKSRRKGKGKMAKAKKTLAELKKEASKNQKSKRKYLRRLEKTWVSSAKIEKTMEILRGIQGGEEKTIIFSQFTSLLDLLEVPIVRQGWGYRRYDGSMKPGDRNSAVLDFTDNPDCRIMLVSLKAGNSGLNLIAASQVIIFDPFWNPYIEEQAIDRAHRIGQVREVHIHRILVQNTVEDRILELQDKKRELIEGALDEKASKNISRLGTRELAYLFGVH